MTLYTSFSKNIIHSLLTYESGNFGQKETGKESRKDRQTDRQTDRPTDSERPS